MVVADKRVVEGGYDRGYGGWLTCLKHVGMVAIRDHSWRMFGKNIHKSTDRHYVRRDMLLGMIVQYVRWKDAS